MNLFSFGFPVFSWEFLAGIGAVTLIDIVLAGDNAVIIALAVKGLPKEKRRFGIVFGAGLAVLLRVVLTVFAAQLMKISLVKLVGGILILWIAVKLLVQDDPSEELHHEPTGLFSAIWIIMVADVTMSTDNVLALAGASRGDPFLLLFGVALSIPLVVGASTLLSSLMDRFPIIIYVGAALLGKVGAEMILTDPVSLQVYEPSKTAQYAVEACTAVGVVVVGKLYLRYLRARRLQDIESVSEPDKADSIDARLSRGSDLS